VRKGANVFIFHNNDYSNPIFHPKLYLCLGDHTGVLIVGSNNLTGKGLTGNYEISLMQELDLRKQTDFELMKSAEKVIDTFTALSVELEGRPEQCSLRPNIGYANRAKS
jgi:HKD family nuclease